MAYQTGDTIRAADFNEMLARAVKVYGVGLGDFGYGQTALAQTPVSGRIQANQWNTLLAMVQQCANHSVVFSQPPTVAVGTPVAPMTISDMLNTVEGSRLFAPSGSMSLVTQAYTRTILIDWRMANYGRFDVTFPSENAARYFFNSGGQIRMTFTQPNGSSARDIDLRNTFSKIGTVMFGSHKTSNTGSMSISSSRGFYELGDTYLTMFAGNNLGSGTYADTDVYVLARRLNYIGTNGGNGTAIRFEIVINNVPNTAIVTGGTQVSFDYWRASTHLSNIAAPTFSQFMGFTGVTGNLDFPGGTWIQEGETD